jgi:hypothetical protein
MEAFSSAVDLAPFIAIPFDLQTEWFRSGWHYKKGTEGHFGVHTNRGFCEKTVLFAEAFGSITDFLRRDLIGNCSLVSFNSRTVVVTLKDIKRGEELVIHEPGTGDSPSLWRHVFPHYCEQLTLCIYKENKSKKYLALGWDFGCDLPLSKIWSICTEFGLNDPRTFWQRKPIYFLTQLDEKHVGKVEKKDKGVIPIFLGERVFPSCPLRSGVEKLLTSKLSEYAPVKKHRKRKVIVVE